MRRAEQPGHQRDEPVTASDGGPVRRAVLGLGAGAALTLGAGSAASAAPGPGPRPGANREVRRRLRELERTHGGRLGVFARNTATGRTVRYRADETFPMCSVFKTLAVAAVLRDLNQDGRFLGRRIRYTREFVDTSGGGPVTGEQKNVTGGMTVYELCSATVNHSDNAAANLLLRELGGPGAITAFCRSIDDPVTRLDRWEPELNSAEPGRTTDTTSPYAIARSYERLVLGDALTGAARSLLTGWLLTNTTGGKRLRAGVPADWALGDKTGSGRYGVANDVGVAWTPDGVPVVLSVLTAKDSADAPWDNSLVESAARLLTTALTSD
ncbi:beta-lactamase [Streptomyces inusitatus]|uniref:Beta-lactamase n=1 Tax=Streptomyces inusitatus TaxID=68221 RepID=A0A918Q822_9ACTN|nr:beta-lactamase [Streptomyces inusitatus]